MRGRAFALVLIAACGGDGGSMIADDCAAYCNKQPSCGETVSPSCEAGCEMMAAGYNPAYWDAFVQCYVAASPCDNKTDDTCAGQAFVGLTRRPIDDDFKTKCQAMETRCSQVCHPGEPDLDACNVTVLYSESALTSAEACLDKACGEVCTCLSTTLMY